jgi:hypothetical protein
VFYFVWRSMLILHFYSFLCCTFQTSTGLKGTRNLQFGGLSIATATTDGIANSENTLSNIKVPTPLGAFPLATNLVGVTGSAITSGTSFGSSSSSSPGFGVSSATGAANGFGNSTSKQYGGVVNPTTGVPEVIFGNGFGDFEASGGGTGSFGSPVAIPGTGVPAVPGTAATTTGGGKKGKGGNNDAANTVAATPGTPAIPLVVVPALQTGGGGAGFGFTLGGGIGNVSGDLSYSEAYGTAQAAGFGSGQGASLFGTAGGSGGGTSDGDGGGFAGPGAPSAAVPKFGVTLFNGTGGGLASGGAGGYVGFNPNPVVLGNFPIAP